MSLVLKNPHSVLAALRRRPQDVLRVTIHPESVEKDSAWGQVARLAREHQIPVLFSKTKSSQKSADRGGRLSIAEALVKPKEPVPLNAFFFQENRTDNQQSGGVWLAFDCLQDPHNVGALFRTAAFFGVRGILLTQERSAPLSATVYDIASGGVESVPFSIPTNLRQALEAAKEAGLWILGTSEHAEQPLELIPKDRSWLVVLGNEEKGLRRLTLESCDMVCSITPRGDGSVSSLNVSVAGAIVISTLA